MSGRNFAPLHTVISRVSLSTQKMTVNEQKYDCFLVLDFEATCEEASKIRHPEIIEFPVLKVDAKTFDIVHQFHQYVRPILNPQLTDFCTKLTGITQEMVDESEPFPQVMDKFKIWMNDNTADQKFLFVTCGDWDLKAMLPEQCKREKVDLPPYFSTFMNIKKTYAAVTGVFVKGMTAMLSELNLKHVGKLHSGIDDCNNIVSILHALANRGCIFRPTHSKDSKKMHLPKHHASKGSRQYHSLPTETVKNDVMCGKVESAPIKENLEFNLYPNLKDKGFSNYYASGDNSQGMIDPQKEESNSHEDARQETNYPIIITRLKENISSRVFSHDQENLQVLLASAKYMELMEEGDRIIIKNRLRYYFIALYHGLKTAKQDAKNFGTESVGIHLKTKERLHSHHKHNSKRRGSPRRDKSHGTEP